MLLRGTVGRITVTAKDSAGLPVTGQATNITAYISQNCGTPAQTHHANPIELSAANMPGKYAFIVTAAETYGELVSLQPQCSTSGVYIDPVDIYTLVPEWAPVGRELEYANFVTVGTWYVERVERGETASFVLTEPTRVMEIEIPTEKYSRDEYPNMAANHVGNNKNIAYGPLYRVPCVCINTATKTWQIAGCALTGILNVYNGDGEIVSVSSVDPANAEFIYAWPEDEGMPTLLADIVGKPLATGIPMANAADIKEDLFKTYGGLTDADIDQPALTAARAAWKLGTDNYDREVHSPNISLLISDRRRLRDIMEDIDRTAFGVTMPGKDGKWIVARRMPVPSDGLEHLQTRDFLSFEPPLDASEIVTSVTALYAHNRGGADNQAFTSSSEEARLRAGFTAHKTLEEDILTVEKRYGRIWTSRMLFMLSQPRKTYPAKVTQRAALMSPFDHVLISHSRRGVTREICEIIKHDFDFSQKTGSVTLGDVTGYGDSPAFVVAAAQVFPAWLGGGTAVNYDDSWSEEQKRWWRQNCSAVCNSHEFITDDGTETGTELADTHRVSVVI